MLKKFAVATLLAGAALTTGASAAQMDQAPAASAPAPPPDRAVTARFTAFITQVLAGHVPATNVSDKLRSGMTPQLLGQLRNSVASYGKFRELQYVSQDTIQGYQRYRYTAVFENGNQGFMFVTDSTGAIVGFFEGPSQ